ncbi:pentatricopeptide repeat-containing protein At1g73710 isoform X1 [Punica granatum]|uniref:Pentatricopeptide repeat-containing protein At1g73710 isoform X1 n=2 Tax=Punica granatum TaxID=22663 RepID=A0A6P8CNN2_PUNGR|nr:pentatricopeptide repeat-containing protein At1g73710 isoform X1 [Punica granatum]PKI32055.1 hypothetical protein CRG98_047527 [Punica granatum]
MLIPSCSSRDLGAETLHPHFIPPLCKSHFSSWPHRAARVSPRFNLSEQRIPRRKNPLPGTLLPPQGLDKVIESRTLMDGTRVFVGFKLSCHSRTASPAARPSRKKKYGGVLPLILRSLESDDNLENTLNSLCENLSPKEQTVVLKEQRSSWERLIRVWEFFKSQKDYVPNVIHYNIVLRVLGRAQRWDDLRRCWVEMAKNGVLPTNNTYGMLVDVYGKAGLMKEALLWIKHMRLRGIFPDEVTMNTVVRVLKDAGEFDKADRFYKDWCVGLVELDGLELDSVADFENELNLADISYKHFLSTELFKTGGRAKSFALSDMEASSPRKPRLTSTYNTLIDLYGKAGRLKEAADVFAEMLRSGVPMDTITFNTMIFTCGSHGSLSEAEALLKEMEGRGISPDTKTYNILLSLYADSGNIDAALTCYRQIRKSDLFPDVVTHRAIIHALCERGMVREVDEVIEEVQKSGFQIDEHSLPMVVKMYVDSKLLSKAKSLLESFQNNCTISSKNRAAIMDVYAEKGLWADAESLFFAKRNIVEQQKDILEYNVMIKAYGKAKFYEKAFSLFRTMKNQGVWPDECTYNSLIQMFAGGDLMEQIRDLLAEMQRAGFKPNCLTYSAIIASFARLGLLSEAADMHIEMEKQGVKPNEVVYGSLINGFAEIGRVKQAFRYLRQMEECGVPSNHIILTSLIKAYAKMGYVQGARSIYEKMKSMEGGSDIVASNSMIGLYADLGMVSEAKVMFETIQSRGEADGISFATMMRLYKGMGMLDEAIEVAEEMKKADLLRDCNSYNKVMACYATKGLLLECGKLLHEMMFVRKILPDSGTFKVIFVVLKKGGMPIEAVSQLESCYHEGKPYARQAIISCVFSLVGLHNFARESCKTLLKAKVALDSSIYNACIYVYGEMGETDQALNLFMKMQDNGLRPDLVTYVNLLNCYGKAGMIEGVRRVHNMMKRGDIKPNESLLNSVMDAYRKSNRHDLAELVSKEMRFELDLQQYADSGTESEPDETPPDL